MSHARDHLQNIHVSLALVFTVVPKFLDAKTPRNLKRERGDRFDALADASGWYAGEFAVGMLTRYALAHASG